MGDYRVTRCDFRKPGEGQVTKGSALQGDMDYLLVLAHSAELMSRCDGNFDAALRINQNNEDRASSGKSLDEMQNERVSEDDGFQLQGNNLAPLSQIHHLEHCENNSLVQESNVERFVEPLLRKKVRLTEIKCEARSKHGLIEQQMVGEYESEVFRGKAIRLTKLRCLARSKDAGIWAQKLGLVDCHTSEDKQREQMMAKQCASEAICQLNCIFSEVETIDEYGTWSGIDQLDGQMWCEQMESSGSYAYAAQTPKEANSGTSITNHPIAQVIGDSELNEQHHSADQLTAQSNSKREVKLREQQQMDQHVPSLELGTFSHDFNAGTENKMECTKGSTRLSNVKRKARSAKCLS